MFRPRLGACFSFGIVSGTGWSLTEHTHISVLYGERDAVCDRNAFMDIRGSPTVAWRLYCIADMCVLQTHGLRGTGREAFYGEGTRDCRREGGGKGERVRRIAEWKKTLTGGLFVWKWKWAPWKWRPEVWDEPSEGQGVDDLTMKNCGFICINWKF